LTELSVRLPPLPIAGITINTAEPAALYLGALYVGVTPGVLSAPQDSWMQLSVETPDKKSASTAFIVNDDTITLRPVEPPAENAVDTARRGFYGAWGRFWIALPVALVLNSMYMTYLDAYKDPMGIKTEDDYNTAQMYQYATIGAAVAAVGFGVEFAIRLVNYVVVSNKERSPLAADTNKTGETPAENPPLSPPEEAVPAGEGAAGEAPEGVPGEKPAGEEQN
jgi:hypothetical protein